MHGRLRMNVKIGIIILAFSILITCAFTGAMFWFGTMTNQVQIDYGGIYRLSSAEYTEVVINGGFLQMNAKNLIGTQRYYSEMYNQLLKNLIPVSFVFLTILFLLSLCLWLLLKQIQAKRTFKIAKELNDSITETVLSNEPALAAAYANLKEQFDNRLNDFKRLSSYLTHEQKNGIAILRAKMELEGNTEYIEKLDDITDSIDDNLTLSDNTESSPQTVVDVSIVCAEVFDDYRKIADNIFFEYEEEEDTEIFAKRRWIYRAVANLLDNAIKYGQGNPITLSVRAKNGSVIVEVRDNGIGISEDKQEAIFNERYRISELNKDGYGIGLSLVSHVCDLSGGFVTVESEPQKGSAFYMSFPQHLF